MSRAETQSHTLARCVLPDDYIRKMKQDLGEVEAHVESKTRYEPDTDAPLPDDDASPI